MKNIRAYLILMFVLFMVVPFSYANYMGVQQEAPFSVTVDPEKTTAKAGDDVTYTIDIIASTEFSESITFILEIEAPSYYDIIDVGIQDPPFPKQFQYTIPIPDDVPASITAYATITASSMSHTVTEEVEIDIQSGNIIGGILGWILKVFQAFGNFVSNLFG